MSMNYYDDEHDYGDSFHPNRQEHQQIPSEYGVETNDGYRNCGIVDNGKNQTNHSIDHSDSSSSSCKLFVGGVSWETTKETFVDYFGKYGEIVDSVIMTDRNTGRPRGFGFVTFADPVAAETVLKEEHIIDGRKVELKRTVPRQGTELNMVSKGNKIFVGGLPSSLIEDDLKEYFSFYGNIVEHQIMYDRTTGRSRGFGFVTFQTDEAVDRVLSERKQHELGDKQVEVKRAEPRRAGRDFNNNGGRPYRSQVYGDSYGYEDQYNGDSYGYEDQYNGKGSGNYSGVGGYGGYSGYGGYGGSYMGNTAGFYGGYGGYGYGYGFGPAMYGFGYGGYGNTGGGGYGGGAAGYGSSGGNGESFTSEKDNGTSGSAASRYHPYR